MNAIEGHALLHHRILTDMFQEEVFTGLRWSDCEIVHDISFQKRLKNGREIKSTIEQQRLELQSKNTTDMKLVTENGMRDTETGIEGIEIGEIAREIEIEIGNETETEVVTEIENENETGIEIATAIEGVAAHEGETTVNETENVIVTEIEEMTAETTVETIVEMIDGTAIGTETVNEKRSETVITTGIEIVVIAETETVIGRGIGIGTGISTDMFQVDKLSKPP